MPPLPPHITLKQAKAFAVDADRRATRRRAASSSAPRDRCSPRSCPARASDAAPRRRSAASPRRPTKSRPTRRKRTARSHGTAPRWSSSRSKPAARPVSATPTATPSIVSLIERKLAELITAALGLRHCRRQHRAVARHPQSRPLGAGRDGDLGGRCGAVGSEGEAARSAGRALLGRCRDASPIYGSGGLHQLFRRAAVRPARRLGRARRLPLGQDEDRHRAGARSRPRQGGPAGDRRCGPFVDANGAFSAKQALALAERIAEHDVTWFEEPVSSDDLHGLALMRSRARRRAWTSPPANTATTSTIFAACRCPSVDVLQADVTRCGGITGFLQVAALCEAHHIDLSGHCAPALHLHAACAAPRLRHLEWFHDHVRIEHMLFDGAPVPRDGGSRRICRGPVSGSSSRLATPSAIGSADASRNHNRQPA